MYLSSLLFGSVSPSLISSFPFSTPTNTGAAHLESGLTDFPPCLAGLLSGLGDTIEVAFGSFLKAFPLKGKGFLRENFLLLSSSSLLDCGEG